MDKEFILDLQNNGLVIIQKESGFKFGTDAVLLSDYASSVKADKILDLCTGNGIIPILLSAKTTASSITGIEIQHEIADTAKRSVSLNMLNSRVFIDEGDLRCNSYPINSFDMITCNPPYMKCGSAVMNQNDSRTIARHEVMCTIDDVTKVSAALLKNKGHLVMVHRPSRLSDVIFSMKSHHIEPKRLRMVHSSVTSPPSMFLIDGILNGGQELKIEPPLILTNPDGSESEEYKKIYGRNN